MVVTLAIMTLILAMTVMQDRNASKPLKILNQAYEVALFIREAQVKGTSVVGSGANFDRAFVVHIDPANNDRLTMYLDENDNGTHLEGESSLDTLVLENGMTVTGCVGTIALPDTTCGITNIAFKRPHLDARIRHNTNAALYAATEVTVTDASGIAHTVLVYNTGLISVE